MLEGEAQNALGCLACDELDRLYDAIHHHVLDAGVFSFCVLANEHGIDIVVGGLVADDGLAGTKVGEKVECSAKGQIEGNMTFANRSLIKINAW